MGRMIVGMADLMANALTSEEIAAGFRLLFDGRSTDGWRTYNSDRADAGWQITGDSLMFHPAADPQYGHDLMTVEKFDSFELRLQWKLWAKGNSGIFYHVVEASGRACFWSGIEYQLLDNNGHPDAAAGRERQTGACYGLYAPAVDVVKPLVEWNDTSLLVDGDRVRHTLNGTIVTEYTLGSPDWNRRVAESKFGEWPSFAAERNGHLLLQDHLEPVGFRTIRVRRI